MISVKNLTKKYGDFTAVDDLSFDIEDGHIYGFLGPNGAGKSTTMNIITGCLAATSGEVKIGGYDIFEDAKNAKKLIGYLPEQPPLYTDQTPREYLHFVAMAKGVDRAHRDEEVETAIAETHIEEVADKLIKNLSKGYKQRVGIAQALLGNPQVIILDEPTVGLDPVQIIEIRELINELVEKHTVILSSHILTEVQAICEKVLIIHKGRLVAFDDLDNLSKALGAGRTIDLECEASREELLCVLEGIQGVDSIEVFSEEPEVSQAVLTVTDENIRDICRDVFKRFSEAQLPLLKLNPVEATLEDVFIKLTGGEEVHESDFSA